MRSMLQALIWENFARAGWAMQAFLASSFSFVIVFASISSTLRGGLGQHPEIQSLLETALMPTVMLLILVGVGTGLWPVRRLYTKPISNLSITAWLLGGGCALILLQLPLVIGCYNYYFDAGWPLAGAVLFALTLWTLSQPFFLVGTRSLSWMTLTAMPIVLLGAWFMSRYGLGTGQKRDWSSMTPSEITLLVVGLVVGCVLTHEAVKRDRCGQCQPGNALWLLKSWMKWLDERSMVRPNYRSARAAHFWYLWPVKGLAMVLAMGFVLAVILVAHGVRSALGWSSPAELQEHLAGLPMGFAFVHLFYGFILGFDFEPSSSSLAGRNREGARQEVDRLSSFTATLPITDRALARINLALCASGIALAFGLWLVVYVITYGWIGISHGWLPWLPSQVQWSSYVLVVGLSWMMASNCMAVVCLGRMKLCLAWIGGVLFAYFVGLGLIYWLTNQSVVIAISDFVTIVFTLSLAALTVGCYYLARKRSLIGSRSTALAVVIAVAAFGIVDQFLQSPLAEHWSAALNFACLCILPWAATPLAIALNRHR